MFSSIIGDSRAPAEGFFGNIGSAFETGIAKIGSEILPNWVQSQATRQSGDQLNKSTFDSTSAPDRMIGQPIQDAEAQPKARNVLDSIFSFETGNIGNMPFLIIAGAVVIGIVIVLKKV